MTASVLVYLDAVPADGLRKAHRELLAAGRILGPVAAAVTGTPSDSALAELAESGVETVFTGPADLAGYLVAPTAAWLAAVARAAAEGGSAPSAVVVDNSAEGKEIAARVGVRLGAGVITDVVALEADGTAHKSVLAGSYEVRAKATSTTAVLAVKGNAAEGAPEPVRGAAAVQAVDPPADALANAARITSRSERPSTGRPELTEASIVVAGGRGTDGDFGPIEELADVLGAAVGASRAATDAGWIGHDFQVGQTGKTVSPQLYISAGISGAIQQKAGMQTSKVIVAVNSDPESPVFEIADFGVVGDLFKVLPQATQEIKRRRG
ncbi:electron transfer flavoprotein subunit alpha/FixB family protein [Sinomonas sp. JGH33]|uniref:Electron transfer flavoprotein subunit alpha/FixB family protein n=1 Tax=Sinomonas terricola TaxID=3110330 RepID=A0ABU5T0X5_9MICC|nr:electron transfer flavoprotein subunit alpha/FixB family protein [Sinomonas sp. JGH33]MEA5453134.1 electron transfer flavoprotein subunit alpha/FixB family protein [Sinomonas sp. JGH33]